MDKKTLAKRVIKEVEKSLVIKENDREFWIENAQQMPIQLLDKFYKYISKQNRKIKEYLKEAFTKNPELTEEINKKIKKIKTVVLELKEKEEQSLLETQIDKIIK